eukprot:2711831-Lingulodinium_polyedra.AAC.1
MDFIGLPSHAYNMTRMPSAKSSAPAVPQPRLVHQTPCQAPHRVGPLGDSQHHCAAPGATRHCAKSAGRAPHNWRKAKMSSGVRRSN